ncbi:MAG: hypothetical protein QOE92_318 [Chloroflexota bacterium]|jgi:3-methyladenine DNA glycosylase AlkD|nr:hypothetical protein [Chloroflexota bacterium]
MPANPALVEAVRKQLQARADPVRAAGQQAYMKSSMPYRGVVSAGVREVARAVLAAHPLTGFDDWRDTLLALWRDATHREERYVALALAGDRRHLVHQVPAALPMYEEMVVTGAWWDYVDDIAVHRLGPMLVSHPRRLKPLMRRWSREPDMWKRRSAIICQVSRQVPTEFDLLVECIEPNLADRDFFIRKAIGWALRAEAWSNPDAVRAYVDANQERLSGLSRREAIKNL